MIILACDIFFWIFDFYFKTFLKKNELICLINRTIFSFQFVGIRVWAIPSVSILHDVQVYTSAFNTMQDRKAAQDPYQESAFQKGQRQSC